MNSYDSLIYRLASYRNWPLDFPSPYSLAETGLLYSGTGDEVHCYKCQCCISHWKEEDIPVERHKRAKPDCPLVASYVLPVSVTSPSSTSGHASSSAIQQHCTTSVQPEPEHESSTLIQQHYSMSVQPEPEHESSSAIQQHYITSVQPEPEPYEKVVRPTLPPQISIDKTIAHVPVSCQKDPLTFKNMSCSELQIGDMNSEAARLRTFENWSYMHVLPEDLAKAGFFSRNIEDCVKCAFCGVILKRWEPGDVPFEEHKRHNPKCQFVQGLSVENIPIKTSATVFGLEPHKIPIGTLPMPPSSNGPVKSFKNSLPISIQDSAKSSDFSDRNCRMRSFSDHLQLLKHHNPEALADAGFYYVGPADSVMCFSCGGELKNWSLSDEPWIEHAKWYPHCNFLLEIKGHAFIEAVRRQRESLERNFLIPSPVDPEGDQKPMPNKNKIVLPPDEELDLTNLKQPYLSTVTSSPQSSTNENVITSASSFPADSSSNNLKHLKNPDEKLENVAKMDDRQGDILVCKICMDETANTVFLPCGHLLCCESCSHNVSECPVCRGVIKGTLKVYIP